MYATYAQGDRFLQVAIEDMGDSTNAADIFNFDLPVSREPIAGLANAVVDLGLPTAYVGKAYAGRYYIEVSIDGRTDADLASPEAFTPKVIDRCAAAKS